MTFLWCSIKVNKVTTLKHFSLFFFFNLGASMRILFKFQERSLLQKKKKCMLTGIVRGKGN